MLWPWVGGWPGCLVVQKIECKAGKQAGKPGKPASPGKLASLAGLARLMIIEDRRRKKTNKIDFNLSMWDTANWLTQTKTDKEIYRQLRIEEREEEKIS